MTDAERMLELFRGSDIAHGRSEVLEKTTAKGKRDSKSWIEKRPAGLHEWTQHLNGVAGIGIPPIDSRNLVRWGAVDVDVYDGNIEELNKRIQDMALPIVVCRSKSGGPHLYLFLSDWVPASLMIERLDSLAGSLGLGTSEIFPKQAMVAEGDYGSWINMPYFGGTKFLRYAYNEEGKAIVSLTDFFAYVAKRTITPETLETLVPPRQAADPLPEGPPCLNTILLQGVQDFRNITLANLAVYCKKAHPETWERELDKYNRSFAEPLGSREVEAIKKSYQKKDYKYQCNGQPLCNYCEASQCKLRKHGVGYQDMLPSNRSLSKLETNPPIWFIDIVTKERTATENTVTVRMSLTSEQLQNPLLFQRRAMETINQMPTLMKRDEWHTYVKGLMKHTAIIHLPPEMTPEGQLTELVEEFCSHRPATESMEAILRGNTYKDVNNYYFRLRDLYAFLSQKRFILLKQQDIISHLHTTLKITKSFKVINGKGVNVVILPIIHDDPDQPLTVPKFESNY